MPSPRFPIKEWNKPFLTRNDTAFGRYYSREDGSRYPSVTTVLKDAYPQDWLHEWRERVGNEVADRISRQAAERGSKVHQKMEDYINGEDICDKDVSVFLRKPLRDIRAQLDKHLSEVYGTEVPIYSNRLDAAGTFDLYGIWKESPTVIDFKTSTHKKYPHQIPHYFVQAAAYAEMLRDTFSLYVPKIMIVVVYSVDEPDFYEANTADWIDEVNRIFIRERKK